MGVESFNGVGGGAVVTGGGFVAGGVAQVRGDDASEKEVQIWRIGRVSARRPSVYRFLSSGHADVSGVLAAEV
eukprot:4419227-Pleurochrysis_carterae.AAC.1